MEEDEMEVELVEELERLSGGGTYRVKGL